MSNQETQKTFTAFIPFARHLAWTCLAKLPRSVPKEDVESAAFGGLWDAACRHQGTDGQFLSYAAIRIRGSIRDELRRQDWLPRHARKKFGKHLSRVYIEELTHDECVELQLSTPAEAEDGVIAAQESTRLHEAVSRLPARERELISSVLAGSSQTQIAKAMNLSQPRITQLLKRAIWRLRESMH